MIACPYNYKITYSGAANIDPKQPVSLAVFLRVIDASHHPATIKQISLNSKVRGHGLWQKPPPTSNGFLG